MMFSCGSTKLCTVSGAFAFTLIGITSSFSDTIVTVPGTADLYLSGQPTSTHCCNGDNGVAESPVLAPIALSSGEYLTFSTTGGASHVPSQASSPTADGDTSFTYNLTADYGTGISGPTNVHLNGLAGVFLGPGTPSGPAPAQLSGTSFSSISPGLDQIFFIGDGLTGTGTGSLQTFYVPGGATRLFLGIIDDGGFYDNSGSIVATITSNAAVAPVPELSTWAMVLFGFCGLGFLKSRKLQSIN